MFETANKTDAMLDMASQLNSPESKGDLIELPQSAQLQASASAVFAEPIVTAQPCRIRRDVPAFLQKIKVLAQMAGEDYCYRFPVKSKDGSKKNIEGPTIQLANDLAREYMNCMVDVRAVEQPTCWLFYARFVDFETGFCLTRAFKQRKGQKTMNTDPERAEDIVFQIGQSKAIRNVVVNALQTFADFAFREAKNSLVTQIGRSLPDWIAKMQHGIRERKLDLKRIERAVGTPIEKWLAPDVARVLAELKSISDGMATFDDIYPLEGSNVSDLNAEFIKPEAAGAPANPTTQPPAGRIFTESSPEAAATKPAPNVSEEKITPAATHGTQTSSIATPAASPSPAAASSTVQSGTIAPATAKNRLPQERCSHVLQTLFEDDKERQEECTLCGAGFSTPKTAASAALPEGQAMPGFLNTDKK